MKANSDVFSQRSGVLIAGTLLVLLALGGCGGGGSSGTGGGSGAGFSYPPSLAAAKSTDKVSGFVSPYALDPATQNLVSVSVDLLAVGSVTGKLSFTISPMTLPSSAGTEPGFVVTFDPASSGSLLANSPLDSSPNCIGCLKTVTATFGAGGAANTVTFTHLDPANATFPLNYSTLGIWSKPTALLPWQEVGGPFSAGVLTRGIDLPITGPAIGYDGYFIGLYATSAVGTYLVGANAHADIDLSGPGVVTFSISNITMSKITGGVLAGGVLEAPSPESRLDLSITTIPITRTSTSNLFGPGVLTNSGFGMAGIIKGGFYGPPAGTAPPPELGGSLAVQNSTQSMIGSFVLKKH